jgi:endonuclease YncB( thermonuclease family)
VNFLSMRTFVVLTVGLAIVTLTAAERFTGRVVGVSDGDTISVLHQGRAVQIRLEGIDCPEDGQAFGERAKQFTSDRVFGREVDVDVRDVDRYGRLVARVVIDGQDLSVALLRAGLAWHYTEHSTDRTLATAELEARVARRGLWEAGSPTPPWEYRRPVPATEGPFHGNVRSRVFHSPTCQDYNCPHCTAEFTSRADAEREGYRPHPVCVR